MNLSKLLTFLLLIISNRLIAQWSNNPDSPLLICTETGVQSKPIIISDSTNGYFLFWLDQRSGTTKVYGQHLDNNGNELWELTGKLIVENAINISEINAILNSDGDVLLAWHAYGDSLYMQKINAEGNAIWAKPTSVAGNDLTVTGSFWGPVYPFAMLQNGAGCFITYVLTGYGYDNLFISKVEGDGSLPWGYNGIQLIDMSGTGIGSLTLQTDNIGGAYLGYTIGLNYVSRFDANGSNIWGPVATNQCTDGTGGTYAGHPYHVILPANDGGIIAAWTSLFDDVYTSKINADGDFSWADSCKEITTTTNGQEGIAFTKSGDYYVAWRDSHPDSAGIYMQKLNDAGDELWTELLLIDDTSFYIPVIKSITTSEGDVVIFYQTSFYFAAQKVYADGTTAWPKPIKILEWAFNPSYQHYQLFSTNDNNVIGIAQYYSGVADENIVAFNLNMISGDTITDPVNITQSILNTTQIFPNPANTTININTELPITSINIFNIQGVNCLQLSNLNTTELQLDVKYLSPGIYFLQIENAEGMQITKIIKS